MTKLRVWKRIQKDTPAKHWCVKCKCGLKMKQNGVFNASLVAYGYSQIPGVDFTENYSPVVHDITFCLLLIAKMIYGLSKNMVDLETSFCMGISMKRYS